MFNSLTTKLALVATTAVIGLGAVTSTASASAPMPLLAARVPVQPVPEPASILGLLAIGTVGTVGTAIKRNQKQKD